MTTRTDDSDPGQSKRPTSRRGFLELVLGGSITGLFAAIVFPVWRFLFPPASVPIGDSSVLAGRVDEMPPNSGNTFMLRGEPAILIRTPGGEFRAFTAICTHLACTVQYRSDFEHIWCACHNGHYDLTGKNIQGPPPRPLSQFVVERRGNEVYVRSS